MTRPRPHPPARRDQLADAASSPEPAARHAAGSGLAGPVWELMSGFVRSHDRTDELRRTLGLGRGAGRVRVLMSLAAGPLSLAELAQATGADPSYTTIIVNELQALGLLTRTPDPSDRRRKTVELTPGGRQATRKARDIIGRPPPQLRDLSAADLRRLHQILSQLSRP